MPNFGRSQGRSQSRRCQGAPASGRWARGGCEQMSPIPPRGSGVRDPRILLYIFKYKILHSDAFFGSENGQYQCFIECKTFPPGQFPPDNSPPPPKDIPPVIRVRQNRATPSLSSRLLPTVVTVWSSFGAFPSNPVLFLCFLCTCIRKSSKT